jgi:type III pantothenate kinase
LTRRSARASGGESPDLLLAVDIGNTNITLGLYPLGATSPAGLIRPSWRLATQRGATADEYGIRLLDLFHYSGIPADRVHAVVIASVVPPLDPVFAELTRAYFNVDPLVVGPRTPMGIRNRYAHPDEVGADRLVDAAAAYARHRAACVIVDFGTATTFDCVTARGDYLGGAIAPGPHMAAEALAQRTAKLPLLGAFRKPAGPIGRTTLESLNAGLYYGYVGLTEGLLRRILRTLGGKPRVIATGGLAPLLAPAIPAIHDIAPDLTLEGLFLIWKRNSKSLSR